MKGRTEGRIRGAEGTNGYLRAREAAAGPLDALRAAFPVVVVSPEKSVRGLRVPGASPSSEHTTLISSGQQPDRT
jgi:hypothetical protein